MTIYIVPNVTKHNSIGVAIKAAEILMAENVRVIMDEQLAGYIPNGLLVRCLPQEQAFDECDVVVTVGGDGTMLHVARRTMYFQKPMLGINMGRLGFLTTVEHDELNVLLRLPQGEYTVENRSVLQVQLQGEDAPCGFALNDILLFKQQPDKTITLDIYCDDIKVSGFRGDGMIFATPTGSTAYSMSAGGPILDARLGGIVATQICAHIIHTPPMVFAADRVLCAVPKGDENEQIMISCDGQQSQLLSGCTPVIIKQANLQVPMVEFLDAGQLKSIDKKLKGR